MIESGPDRMKLIAEQSLAQLKAEDFYACIDKQFAVALEEGGDPIVELKLVSVSESGETAPIGGRSPFSLAFEGASEIALDQGIYWLKRSELGELGIFIVPIGHDGNVRTYEAIFS